ncbi:MAG TPA: OmpH family outer membrane protein [Acidobacteriota bacterium]|nr:OmpH family outer membrane protein [Acidobacteriota bacterium]
MRHRVPVLVVLLAAAAAGLAGHAAAQEAAKLGMINSQEILDKSAEGKRALAQLQAADKKYSDQVTQLDEQIKQLQSRLSSQRLTLTAEAAAAIQADIQKKQTDRQRAAEDATLAMRQLQSSTLEKLQTDLLPIIEQVRKDLGFDLIFDVTKGGVIYFNPAIDVTAEIIKRYDALKAPAPPVKK